MTGRHRAEQPAEQQVEFTVLAGEPTAEELAAVTAVLTTMAEEADADAQAARTPARSRWGSGRSMVRAPFEGGRGGWGHGAAR